MSLTSIHSFLSCSLLRDHTPFMMYPCCCRSFEIFSICLAFTYFVTSLVYLSRHLYICDVTCIFVLIVLNAFLSGSLMQIIYIGIGRISQTCTLGCLTLQKLVACLCLSISCCTSRLAMLYGLRYSC